MKIGVESIKVLHLLYQEIQEDPRSLMFNIVVAEFLEKHKISKEYLSICTDYLASKGLLEQRTDILRDYKTHNINESIFVSAAGVDLIENEI